eukprot:2774154-Pleurochrysis_carterae.AAC.3
MRHYGYLPGHRVNWLIGQKACGCAAATLICLKAGTAEARGVIANKPGRTWILCAGTMERFQDAGVKNIA